MNKNLKTDKLLICSQYQHNATKETFMIVGTDRDRLPYRSPTTIYLVSLWDNIKRVVLEGELESDYTYIPPMEGAYK